MSNELTRPDPPRADMSVTKRGIQIKTFNDMWRLATCMVKGGIAPKGMTAESAFGVMAMGMELGLSPIQSLKDISFINGRGCAFGDAISALILKSGLLEGSPQETLQGEGEKMVATCTLKRIGVGEVTRSFSMADAAKANLLQKDSWKMYPKRMLRWRAFGWAARDLFADVLKGLHVREEVEDMPPVKAAPHVLPSRTISENESPFDGLPRLESVVVDPVNQQTEAPEVEEPKASREPGEEG